MRYSIEDYKNGILKIKTKSSIIDIDKTFNCGQCFRWNKDKNNVFYGIVGDDLILVKQQNISENDIYLNIFISQDKINDFINYLGLNDDYSSIQNIELSTYEKSVVNAGAGIRILHQDIWETLISFIISQRNSIPKIKNTIERLSSELGKNKIKNFINFNKEYFMFPTPDDIIRQKDKLYNCGLGYRDEYVYLAAKEYKNNEEYFTRLKMNNISSDTVVQNLMQLKGVGPKVANCVALFGYNRLDMFPIDVWIQRIIDREYGGNIDIKRFGSLAGLIQQYMFYNEKFV